MTSFRALSELRNELISDWIVRAREGASLTFDMKVSNTLYSCPASDIRPVIDAATLKGSPMCTDRQSQSQNAQIFTQKKLDGRERDRRCSQSCIGAVESSGCSPCTQPHLPFRMAERGLTEALPKAALHLRDIDGRDHTVEAEGLRWMWRKCKQYEPAAVECEVSPIHLLTKQRGVTCS